MHAPRSLRTRLVLSVFAVAAIGLTVADVATYSSLRSFLFDRTDRALDTSHHAVEATLGGPPGDRDHGGGPRGSDGQSRLSFAAPGDYVQIRTLDGRVVARASSSATYPPPKLPASISLPSGSTGVDRVRYFTVPATRGDSRYRVRASIEPGASNLMLIVAAPLREVDSTLHRLLMIELLVTGLVLAGIAALGLWLVRLSLRPLEAIGDTAAAIAAGDLTRRVEPDDERTEIGRLGHALNAMLTQIESAFRAREASERKLRRFVADASHELRTPLAAVRAYAELFTRGASTRPDDLARSMSGISRESERMSLLVDDLLLLARLDEGRPLEREPVELETVVREAVDTARMLEPGRPVEVDLEPAQVIGDRDRLRQTIDNLLSNVRAHTPADAAVSVSLQRRNGHAFLTVTDTGPGLSADQAAHVFERFYRTDASRTRASGGVGLGLSIVAAVVEAHGGSVSVDSTPGRGTTFAVELPSSN
jgi:two-component system OmpR family sensor kinase